MGIVVYVVLMRWLTGEAVLAAVLITIALGILLRGLSILIWTSQQFYPATMFGWRNPPVRIRADVQISAASAGRRNLDIGPDAHRRVAPAEHGRRIELLAGPDQN